ncbi:UDP-2,3-diacetamido-2,3-dideoxy-D-glucuronate 2-epimerase [subsurface metagenome]
MKIISVVGVRPNFIKIAPIIRAIDKHNKSVNVSRLTSHISRFRSHVLVHTGQRYDYEMSKVFFEDLELPEPDIYLGVGSGTHAEQTGKVMIEFERILLKEKPDLVIVVGDVNSTLAAALASVKLHIPVAHVEAGLRSFDREMPEEINRVLTDHCSQLLFCPTETAVKNLKKEGITQGVYLTGDVMVDTLLSCKQFAERSKILVRLGLKSKQYLVATIHRSSNTDRRRNLENIMNALSESGESIVFPIHPRTRKVLSEHRINMPSENVKLIDPLGYLEFLKLMSHAKKIITDSGGIQKETYILRVPCVTIRKRTEWVETVEDGWNILVDANKEKIIEAIRNFEPSGEQGNIFGNGTAATTICETTIQWISERGDNDLHNITCL